MTDTDDTHPPTAHSPEPWHVEPLVADHGASIAICNRQQGILAVIPPLNEDDEPDERTAQRDPCDQANARRIVAAVNACQGIPTDALEQGVVAGMRAELKWLVEAVFSTGISEAEAHRITMSARAALARATAA